MVRPLPPVTNKSAPGTIRLFLPFPLAEGQAVLVSAPQAHYLTTVMRRGVGDTVHLFNGRDGEFGASIAEIRRDQCRLAVGGRVLAQSAEPDIWLAFALLKRGPTELIVQKATELGASALMPLFTTRTSADRTNLDRLRAIAIEAAEQCERLTVPVIHPARALNAVLTAWPAGRRLIACFERGADLPMPRGLHGPSSLLIGPEGGFTDAELDAVRSRPFVVPVTLGPRVLRAETAAIVGLALLQAA
jgi:16S rRNA (uracil1498-N3)-methyltransferase